MQRRQPHVKITTIRASKKFETVSPFVYSVLTQMDPITLFGIATAAVVVGIIVLYGLKLILYKILDTYYPQSPQLPAGVVLQVPATSPPSLA